MGFFRANWVPIGLSLLFFVSIASSLFKKKSQPPMASFSTFDPFTEEWLAPDTSMIPATAAGEEIRYGRELIVNTAKYLGPKGIVAAISNGMNCQNCHIDAGTKPFGNCFSAVASTYPKYRDRSGKLESIEFRVNECMERSLNGQPLDSNSMEMRAMVAYLKWVGSGVPQNFKPKGAGTYELPYLDRVADTMQGKAVYLSRCQRCHGEKGNGLKKEDGASYTYPPLWGNNSYNVSAGMYRLSRLAGFIKDNMPFDSVLLGYKLSNEEAWDVAAYINSQPRPQKRFAYNWPNIAKKPVDYPFGPYADSFSERQHKYGPFGVMKPLTASSKRKEAVHRGPLSVP